MKIVNLKRLVKYPDRHLYLFNLSLEGFIVNGFVYSADSGAVLMPTVYRGGKRLRVVKAFGIQVKRLKVMLERETALLPPLVIESG